MPIGSRQTNWVRHISRPSRWLAAGAFSAAPLTALATETAPSLTQWKQTIGEPVRARVLEIARELPTFGESAYATLLTASPDQTLSWYLGVLVWVALSALVGWLAATAVQRWGRAHFVTMFNPEPKDRAERIGYLLLRTTLMLVGVAVFYAAASLAWVIFGYEVDTAEQTQEAVHGVIAFIWALRVVFLNVLAPDVPTHRVLDISDTDAVRLDRAFMVQVSITGLIGGLCVWMNGLGLSENAHLLAVLAGSVLAALVLSFVIVRFRTQITVMALGPIANIKAPALQLLARTWHVLVVLYIWASLLAQATRLLLDLPARMVLSASPVIVLLLGLAIYGVLVFIIDRVAARPRAQPQSTGTDQTTAENVSEEQPTYRNLAEHGAAILVWAGAIWLLLSFWGINVGSGDSWLVKLADVLVVVFLTYLGYQGVKIAIDRRISEEGGFEPGEPGDEGGGGSASRLPTLLPLFRNFVLATLVVMAVMIVLSQLGLDIAPLFAGAGVIGLAVGFGAQTLIRDIFSGAFFLLDDAFRVGEYIDIEGTRGTVEKISIRSMQLRHHLGALHTIPFGEIKQLTNHSRDWAMMKLELRVTYDTDVEKVRKLIKKLGAQLLEDETIGDKFVQPLKSQGVFRMEDSAMIIRVKFMTEPGNQFVVRKQVYAQIRDLFDREGIRFAHREVTVRVAQEEPVGHRGVAAEAAGAALPLLESEGEHGTAPRSDR